jgi:hypothetical protein
MVKKADMRPSMARRRQRRTHLIGEGRYKTCSHGDRDHIAKGEREPVCPFEGLQPI